MASTKTCVIPYSLQAAGSLKKRSGTYWALPKAKGSVNDQELLNRIMKRNASIHRANAAAMLALLQEEMADVLAQGYNLNLSVIQTRFAVHGVFKLGDAFNSNLHKLKIRIRKGRLLRGIEENIALKETASGQVMPYIQVVTDGISKARCGTLTGKGVIELLGSNLKIEGENPACGLWFIAEDKSETKVSGYVENKPKRLIAPIPDLAPGQYKVKVVTQWNKSGIPLKKPKSCIYPEPLTLQSPKASLTYCAPS